MKSKYGILDEDLDGDVDFNDYLLTDDDEEDVNRRNGLSDMDDLDFDEMNDFWDELDETDL
ncbi:MAG: hypothetical protein SPK63_02015 [Eubacteriales bacterium]|nr:hypothetical protein [Eubacteriales bacterium]